MFGTFDLVRNPIKSKFICNGWGTAFDAEGSWSFDIDSSGNVLSFGVDNTSPSDIDRRKKNFLVLDEGPPFGINDSIGAAEKKIVLTLVKQYKILRKFTF